jgi:hypothetical protein
VARTPPSLFITQAPGRPRAGSLVLTTAPRPKRPNARAIVGGQWTNCGFLTGDSERWAVQRFPLSLRFFPFGEVKTSTTALV